MNSTSKSKQSTVVLYVAWVISIVATLGSLFFSEIQGFIPCELCWYQRILMYPLVVILGAAVFTNDFKVKRYVLPLTIIGIIIGIMHYLQQKVPSLSGLTPCEQGVPCNVEYINWLGFITIPFLSLTAFVLITICVLLIKKDR